MMDIRSRINNLKEQPETARVGVKWTEEENNQLMMKVMEDNMDLEDIAKEHKRTVGAVKSRIMMNALRMMNDKNITLQDVAKLVHIPENDIENYKQKQEIKNDKQEKKVLKKTKESSRTETFSYEDVMSILSEIRDYLKLIAEK